ncbi:MAG: hypothetical protein NTW20_00550 [Rhodobacterales bacterium]|nr:hypothetical protein [Rhodobacterales bacterium]
MLDTLAVLDPEDVFERVRPVAPLAVADRKDKTAFAQNLWISAHLNMLFCAVRASTASPIAPGQTLIVGLCWA